MGKIVQPWTFLQCHGTSCLVLGFSPGLCVWQGRHSTWWAISVVILLFSALYLIFISYNQGKRCHSLRGLSRTNVIHWQVWRSEFQSGVSLGCFLGHTKTDCLLCWWPFPPFFRVHPSSFCHLLWFWLPLCPDYKSYWDFSESIWKIQETFLSHESWLYFWSLFVI